MANADTRPSDLCVILLDTTIQQKPRQTRSNSKESPREGLLGVQQATFASTHETPVHGAEERGRGRALHARLLI